MPEIAGIWSGYCWRIGLITVMCLGFGGWSLYDGLVKYPLHNEMNRAYEHAPYDSLEEWWYPVAMEHNWPQNPRELLKAFRQLPESSRAQEWPGIAQEKGWLQDSKQVEELDQAFRETGSVAAEDYWPAVAAEHNWPEDPNDRPHRKTKMDIMTQFIMFAITFPIGLVFGTSLLRHLGRWVEVDEEGIKTSWGHNPSYESISRLNKRRWYKGIAVVHYRDGDRNQKLLLDDWKFDRARMDAIVEHIESKLSPDQIEGAPQKTAEDETDGEEPTVESDETEVHEPDSAGREEQP